MKFFSGVVLSLFVLELLDSSTFANAFVHHGRVPRRLLSFSRIHSTKEAVVSIEKPVPPPPQPQQQVDQFKRGDTRGAALLIEEVAISRGASQILTNINWRVEPKAKWGIVGSNGCGKSTLLKGILGQISLDDGTILVGTTQHVGYLPQTAVAGSNRTIFEEAASAMKQIEEARQALERAQNIVAAGTAADPIAAMAALDTAMEQFAAVGGYTQEQQVETVLKGLGFKDMNKRCDELSGGWQMRVSLARLLLSQPTLCILDEPGNHLDVSAKNWLAGYLKSYTGGAMLLVTHDVQLLNAVDHIAEINMGQMQLYKSCTHDQYLQEREFRAQAAQAEYERNLEKAAKLQGFVDRFGASATKASAAQSRVKQIEKMREQGLLDAPADHLQNQRFRPRLRLPKPPKAIGETLLYLKNGQVGHSADLPLISDLDLRLNRGMKLLLRGPNGCGKSTILHSLRGQLQLLQGQLIPNEGLQLGVFTQDLAQELPAKARAVDLVTAYGRTYNEQLTDQEARTVMGALGLTGEKALQQICELSGGEKARVALAMFALKPSNLYLLDEVSNHLDIECIEALSEAVGDWGTKDGCVVVISHDRNFCDKITFTHVGTVRNGKLYVEEREVNENDWVIDGVLDMTTGIATNGSNDPSHGNDSNGATTKSKKELDPKLRKKAFNAPKRIVKLEALTEELEKKVAALDEEMITHGHLPAKVLALSKEKEQHQAKIAEYFKEWQELEALLAMIESESN